MAGSIGEDGESHDILSHDIISHDHFIHIHCTHAGSVRVYSLESSEVLCHVKYPSGGSSLIWGPLILDASGMTLVAGFTDGVVRYIQ